MKAFITGGTGFIGSHLADALLRNPENEVRCLIRSSPKWLDGKEIIPIKGDLHDLPALKKGLDGADILFHLAALVKAKTPDIFYKSNVEATENIIRCAQKSGVKKMVILSSLAAAGPSFSRPLNEEDPLMPVSMYGESKKLMEEMIQRVAKADDCISILRPPAVFGPREEQIYSFFKIASRGICPIVGGNSAKLISMVHVGDVVQGLLLASTAEKPGISRYFVSSEEEYSWTRIKDATAKALGRRLVTLPVSPGLVSTAGTILETLGAFVGQYPIMNKDKAKEMTLQWTCSVEKIRRELGYRQIFTLEDGISDTISWYRRHGWL
ncbi:MAG: NAD(P)-dependent oxidoreductase [Balneolales bacterium]|nr:NAD(P)-dependent oxidoreductase [Balneolales bacterium]